MGPFGLLALIGGGLLVAKAMKPGTASSSTGRSSVTQSPPPQRQNPWDETSSGIENQIGGAINTANGAVSWLSGLFGGKGDTEPQPDPYALGDDLGGGGTGEGFWGNDVDSGEPGDIWE